MLLLAGALLSQGRLCAAPAQTNEPLPGFQNPSVRVMVDKAKPMPSTGTFGWGMCVFRVETVTNMSLSVIDKRLKSAMLDAFIRKGFAFAEEAPDYLVSYALAGGAEIDEEELNRLYGDFLKMPSAPAKEQDGLHYTRGVLIVDVVDRKAKHLKWRGAIFADIDMAWPEARKQERCNAAIGQLMRYFPLPPDGSI
jgi:hypothetical protein